MNQSTTGTMLNGFSGAEAASLSGRVRGLLHRRDEVLSPGYKLLYERPLELVRGEGTYMFDADGTAYLDAYNNVASLGHCHPRVVEAVQQQVARLNTNTRYLDEALVAYAERLIATHAEGVDVAAFTCTGSEAIDLSLRIARRYTGKRGVVVTANAYHGMTEAASAISPSLGRNVPLDAAVRAVPITLDGAREKVDGDALVRSALAAVDDLERHGIGVAAFVADSIFSTDGLLPASPGFLTPLADALRARGVLYIADEVQPGFARTGTHWWGYQRHDIVPDLVAMGKPMGNGLPIAGVAARREVLQEFGMTARYFNTFGANSVSVAAARAVLDTIVEDGLLARCGATGRYIADGLTRVCSDHDFMGTVRWAGLYFGVDVSGRSGAPDGDPAMASRLVNKLREQRVLISTMGPHGSVLKIRPPLTTSREEADFLLEEFEMALKSL